MKKLYACILVLSIAIAVPAQLSFQKTYGAGKGRAIERTADQGFIILGYAEGNTTGISLVKTDSLGEVEWSRFYTSGTDALLGYAVQQTNDGGYIITGSVMYASVSSEDIVLLKTSSNGTLEWKKYFGIGTSDYGFSVQQTRDSGYVITGQSYADVVLLKTDSNGNLLWAKTIGLVNSQKGKCVQQTSDDGFIITGFTNFGAGAFDVYLVKTDEDGNVQWTRTYGGAGSDFGNAVHQTTDHGYIIAGSTESYGAGAADVYLVKTDSAGNLQWTRTYGGMWVEEAYALEPTQDGGWIMAGTTNTYGMGSFDVYLVKTDSTGVLQWSRTFGGPSYEGAYGVAETNDNGFAVIGYSESSFALFAPDIYFIRTSSTGNGECNTTIPVSNVSSGGVTGSGGTEASGATTGNLFVQTNGAGPANTVCPLMGIDDGAVKTAITVYPNPFSSITTLQAGTVLANATLVVFNSSGQEVVQINNISGSAIMLSRESLTDGFYFYQLTQDEKIVATGKLILVSN